MRKVANGVILVVFGFLVYVGWLASSPVWPTSHGQGTMQQAALDFCAVHKTDPNYPGCVVQAPAEPSLVNIPPPPLNAPEPVVGTHAQLMAAAHIDDPVNANEIFTHESGWNWTIFNRSCYAIYGAAGAEAHCAYGVCQSLPGTKMASFGADWRTNPVTQLKWCDWWAHSKYHSWAAAWAFWQRTDPRPYAGHWW